MEFSRGRCLLTPLMNERGWSQAELSRRTGYKRGKKKGYSPRMISHFANFDALGNGKLMSPEAMYTISRLLDLPCMELLYEWNEIGDAE